MGELFKDYRLIYSPTYSNEKEAYRIARRLADDCYTKNKDFIEIIYMRDNKLPIVQLSEIFEIDFEIIHQAILQRLIANQLYN